MFVLDINLPDIKNGLDELWQSFHEFYPDSAVHIHQVDIVIQDIARDEISLYWQSETTIDKQSHVETEINRLIIESLDFLSEKLDGNISQTASVFDFYLKQTIQAEFLWFIIPIIIEPPYYVNFNHNKTSNRYSKQQPYPDHIDPKSIHQIAADRCMEIIMKEFG